MSRVQYGGKKQPSPAWGGPCLTGRSILCSARLCIRSPDSASPDPAWHHQKIFLQTQPSGGVSGKSQKLPPDKRELLCNRSVLFGLAILLGLLRLVLFVVPVLGIFVVFHASHLALPLFLPRSRLIYIHSNLMVKNRLRRLADCRCVLL